MKTEQLREDAQVAITAHFSDASNRGIASVDEVAKMTGLSSSRVRNEARDRNLRRVGNAFLYTQTEVNTLLDDVGPQTNVASVNDLLTSLVHRIAKDERAAIVLHLREVAAEWTEAAVHCSQLGSSSVHWKPDLPGGFLKS